MGPRGVCFSVLFLLLAFFYARFHKVANETPSFTPERVATCAKLHNELLAKLMRNRTDAKVRRGIAERFTEAGNNISTRMDTWFNFGAPRLKEYQYEGEPQLPRNQRSYFKFQDSPGFQFLSMIDTYETTADGDAVLMTPDAEQPNPWTMFLDPRFYPAHTCVKLYSGAVAEHYDGGIILDMYSGQAQWDAEWFDAMPEKEHWRPLESILHSWVDFHLSGKYYRNEEEKSLNTRSWIERDLFESLQAWDSLLEAIATRISGNAPITTKFEPGLDPALLSQYRLSPFAIVFLSKAKRPSFKYIAPGISTFTPESFRALYSSESPEAWRLKDFVSKEWTEPDSYPSLIFPADQTIGSWSGDKTFDEPWGFSKLTINRRAGLYINGNWNNGDTTQFVDHRGSTSAFQMNPPHCPWGPGRSPRLAEVLRKWEELVRSKSWHVVADYGVTNGPKWFEKHRDSTPLKWPDSGEYYTPEK
jgi:hypothetical protein